MTTQTLHKAVFHHNWTSAKDRADYWTQMGNRVTRWLKQNKRTSDYVNRYVNVNDHTQTSEMVVVFRNRDTALLLKLALS